MFLLNLCVYQTIRCHNLEDHTMSQITNQTSSFNNYVSINLLSLVEIAIKNKQLLVNQAHHVAASHRALECKDQVVMSKSEG
jgi:hypothetical protein